jgi:hypothetical protein
MKWDFLFDVYFSLIQASISSISQVFFFSIHQVNVLFVTEEVNDNFLQG